MYAAGSKTDERIARLDAFTVDYFIAFDYAHGKAGDVVFVLGIKSRHFRGLSAYQCAARLTAAVAHALDNIRHLVRNELGLSDIVQKDERFCALADDVVHAHCHRVDADGVVLVQHKGIFELGAHAVRARHQAIAVRLIVQSVKAAKGAEVAEHAAVISGFDVFFHQFDRFVTRFHVYARALIIDSHIILRKMMTNTARKRAVYVYYSRPILFLISL